VRVGVHTSIAGAVENAAHHAQKIGCDTFQMFSANPRGWKTIDPTPEDCERFRAARAAASHDERSSRRGLFVLVACPPCREFTACARRTVFSSSR
jgi:hypothetical protein